MGRGRLSIGDDTPTGEPENGPRGPYIPDTDDGTRRPGGKEDNSRRRARKRPLPSRTEAEIARKSELGSDRAGEGGS
jgi:hypothetical protein